MPGAEGIQWILSFSIAAVVFGAFAVLFALGKMGGGDVKLAGAMSLWAGPAYAVQLIVIMSLVGLVLSIIYATAYKFNWRWLAKFDDGDETETVDKEDKTPGKNKSIPYGVAIALAGIFVLSQLIINRFD